MRLGIVDVGTNSIHLVIGVLGLNGCFHTILKERRLTLLGEGGLVRNRLARPAMTRAEGVLREYAKTLRRFGVDHVEAVATSAVREASNGRGFVRRIRRKLALPLRVISGREEARLIYLGVMQARRFRGRTLLITIGGGSAQVALGEGRQIGYSSSLLLGCARLRQRFIRHDPAKPREIEALTEHVQDVLGPVVRRVRRHRWRHALACSATAGHVILAAHLRARGRPPADKQFLGVNRDGLRRLLHELAVSTAAQRIELDGLDPRREDLAVPTGVVLLSWMQACGIRRLRFAHGSLREGLIMDYLIRHHMGRTRPITGPFTDLLTAGDPETFSVSGPRTGRRKAGKAR